jgi:hypothetical protein
MSTGTISRFPILINACMAAEALLHALLGEDAGLVPLHHLLNTCTEGSPFFLEERVRSLVETGVLVGTPGAYRLPQPVQTGCRRPTNASCKPPRSTAPRCPFPCVAGGRCTGAGDAAPQSDPSSRRGVPLRDPPLSRTGLHLQTCSHAECGLSIIADQHAAAGAATECRSATDRPNLQHDPHAVLDPG